MNILSQEELDALFDAVSEPEKRSEEPAPPPTEIQSTTTGFSNRFVFSWDRVQKKLSRRGSNIITAEDFNAGRKATGAPARRVADRPTLSPREEMRKSLMKNIPFLMLLAEYGGGLLKKRRDDRGPDGRGKEMEINTSENKTVKGYFEKFFFEEENFKGGITLRVDNEPVSINVTDILVDEEGIFQITVEDGNP